MKKESEFRKKCREIVEWYDTGYITGKQAVSDIDWSIYHSIESIKGNLRYELDRVYKEIIDCISPKPTGDNLKIFKEGDYDGFMEEVEKRLLVFYRSIVDGKI